MPDSPELFQSLLESAPDAMIIADEAGAIVLINAQAEKLFGYPRAELLGRPIELLVPERFRGAHPGHRQDYAKDPHPRGMGSGMELFARRKDGSEFAAEISLSPLRTPQGLRVCSAIRDVTARKHLEEDLRRANESLRERNTRVEAASRMKSQFLANMSHELRTPLNSIIGFTELIQDGKAGAVNADQKEYLGDVLASSRHLLQLINDVLDLAKVEAGKISLLREDVELGPLLASAAAMLRTQAEKRQVTVTVEPPQTLEGVSGDPSRLKQILYNFLSNAIKFSHLGGQVWLRALPEGPDDYRLEVEDKGIGIRNEDQARLFTEFEQLDAGTDKRYQGTGLGLSLCRNLAELMGGRVGVESGLGRGSRFYAVLPRVPRPPSGA